MRVQRGLAAIAAAGCYLTAAAVPASAQFYIKPKDLSGGVVKADDAGIVQPLPGATPDEYRAGLAWTLRAGLNVAALQCGFQPTLLSVNNYNALLKDHKEELALSWSTLEKYFIRVNGKNKVKGTNALDHFQTLTYSSFSTIQAQLNFCQTAAAVGRDALFTPRGQFAELSAQRMRELRNSQSPWGEQAFTRSIYYDSTPLPRFDAICWNKKAEWVAKKCGPGPQNWPPAGTSVAALPRSAQSE